jgi:UDP-2,3-diacylglucosamine pyrophosphatase LpxH
MLGIGNYMKLIKVECLFISDVHLGSKGCNADELLKVLKTYKPENLFIVGDFIDGWLLKKRHYWTDVYTNVIRKILSLSQKGTNVYYITGNHDDFLRNYTPFDMGGIMVVDELEWNGYLITHGDLYDGIVQLKWLGILGSYGYEIAIIFDRFIKRFGIKKSVSKMLKDKVKSAVKFITDYEKQLSFQANSRGLVGVINGHIHTPQNKYIDVKDNVIHYLNCGDWIENNSYIIYNKGQFQLK